MDTLQRKLAWSKKQTSYAWAKYYECERERLTENTHNYEGLTQVVERETTPQFVIDELKDMIIELKKQIECPVCMEIIQPEDIGFTKCGHKYCSECLERLKTTTKKCALCNRKIG